MVNPLPVSPPCRPSLASQHRVGFFLSDRSTQTKESDILDVKRVTHIIQTLIQVGNNYRGWQVYPMDDMA